MGKRLFVFILFFLYFVAVSSGKVFAGEKIKVSSAIIQNNQSYLVEDSRAKILREFLKQYNSPLADFTKTLVEEADKNDLDWKLLAAISGVESTFGQNFPAKSYNAWGWGIYGNNAIYFKSYNEAVEVISKELKQRYVEQWGAKDVYQIGRLYAASPTWSQRVSYFMNQIDKFAFDNPQAYLSLSM